MGKVIITGAGGMLGRYLKEQFSDMETISLGLSESSDIKADLTKDTPQFGRLIIETVIHAAGTEEEAGAMSLNLEGTKRLLKALETNVPKNFVFVSSHKVYSRDAGENITEDANLWASDEVGKSKALAETAIREWCEKRDVTLTIVRPARMFGEGVKGETLRLFNDALNGRYVHIRGNDAKVSIVCALDVAKAIRVLHDRGGLYNAADGRPLRLIDLVESLTANAGAKKRMTHLPLAWAEWVWRLARWIPSIQRNLSPEIVEERMKSRTLDGSRLAEASGITYHDTKAVIERLDKNYPYTDVPKKKPVYEV